MKELSLYKIKENALKSERAVFSIQQISSLISKSKAVSAVYSSRLVKKGLAVKLIKGRISFSEDYYVIASQLVEPSYISFHSALLFHGLYKQITKNIECAATKNTFFYPKLSIKYHKIPPSLFYGFKKYKKDNSYIFVAEPEKAIIDCVYLGMLSKQDIEDLKSMINRKRMRELIFNFKGRGYKKIMKVLLND